MYVYIEETGYYMKQKFIMIFRSIIFYLLLSFWTVLMGLLCIPYLITPSNYLNRPVKIWIVGIFILLKYICQITHEVQGLENITISRSINRSRWIFLV